MGRAKGAHLLDRKMDKKWVVDRGIPFAFPWESPKQTLAAREKRDTDSSRKKQRVAHTKENLGERKDVEYFEGLVGGGMMTGGVDSQGFGGWEKHPLFFSVLSAHCFCA